MNTVDTDSVSIDRRFLITIGVETYRDSAIPDLRYAATDAQQMRDLLEPMGYQATLPELASLSAEKIPARIEAWADETQLTEADVVIVYFAGHGVKADRHYLMCRDTIPGRWTSALASEDLARPLTRSALGHLLVVLDTCYSGAGSGDVVTLALELVRTQPGATGRWSVASARAKQRAQDGAFVAALTQVLHYPHTGARLQFIGIAELVRRVNHYFTNYSHAQQATHNVLDSDGSEPFFCNRDYVPGLPLGDLDLATLNQLRAHDGGHFDARGRGVDHVGDHGDYFTARTTVLRMLAGWLGDDEAHDRKARVITSAPGSGKSALLGRLLALADPDCSARDHTPPEAWPPAGLDIIPLYARRARVESLVSDLAAALGCTAGSRDDVLRILAQRPTPVTIVVDALDEAGTGSDTLEAARIARDLLQPLTILRSVRLIVATCAPLIGALGHAITVIDLDDPEHISSSDIAEYARLVLLDAHDPNSRSPYRGNPELSTKIGQAIARRAGTSFLVARMTARALVHGQILVDTTQAGWQNNLPTDAWQAFAAYLDRFGSSRPLVERMLRPLAYAQGAGLPWSTVWTTLARALSGTVCPDDDLRWLHQHASAYLIETITPDGVPTARLYHETMAEYLRSPGADTDAHRAIANALITLVPIDPITGAREWDSAHTYIRTHLATHAAIAGLLDILLTDPNFVVHAEPDQLLPALRHAATEEGQLVGAIYRASADLHRRVEPSRRRMVLAIDAARFSATHYQRILNIRLPWPPRWATGQQTNSALHATLTDHDDAVVAVACAELDRVPVAVTAGADRIVRVWDLTTNTVRATLGGHQDTVVAIACTELEGVPVAVTAGYDKTVRIWDLGTYTLRDTLTGHEDTVVGVACTAVDGIPLAVTAGYDETVRVWDLTTHTLKATLTGHDGRVAAVACTDLNGVPVAVTAGYDQTVRVWDLTDGSPVSTLFGHEDAAIAVACTELEGVPVAITASDDKTVRVWDLAAQRLHTTLTGHDGRVGAVVPIELEGVPVAVTASYDQTVRVWDLTTGTLRATVTGHNDGVIAVACTKLDGAPVAITASLDQKVQVWQLADALSHPTTINGHTADIAAVTTMQVAADTVAVTGGCDRTVRVWDLSTGDLRATLTGHGGRVTAAACANVDGVPVAVTTSYDEDVRVWDLATGSLRATLTGHDGWVVGVACTDLTGGPVAVTVSHDETVRVWDLTTNTLRVTLNGHEDAVVAVACTNVEGVPLAITTSYDKTVRVWDLAAGTLRHTLTGHDDWVVAVACAELHGVPIAVSAGDDQTVRIWNLLTGKPRATLTMHDGRVGAVVCTELDGVPVAVTACYDQAVRVWDLQGRRQLTSFDFPGYMGGALGIGPSHELILGAGWDLVVIDQRLK